MENVIRKKLNDLIETITPPQKLKKDSYLTLGKYPIIDQGKNYLAGYTNDEKVLLPYGEYVLFGDHTLSVKYINGRFAQGADGLKILKSKENNTKYLYYALCEYNLRNTEYKRHWTQAKEIEIPLPPLAIQKKIVEILDTFTGMIDNLQKELEQRQKQFEHYRDQMLTFKEGEVQMKPIKEIGKLVRGNGLQKKDFTEDGTGCIHYGQIYTRFGLSTSSTLTFVDSQLAAKLTKVSPGDLVIACTSENIEDVCKSVAWLGKEDVVTGGHACVFKHSENPKYIAYCFTTSAFFLQKRKYAYGAKVIDIKTEKLGEITLPVPSLEKQQEIVDKLDTFEALISNIKQEIELRQKQYEYYREKLLTFE